MAERVNLSQISLYQYEQGEPPNILLISSLMKTAALIPMGGWVEYIKMATVPTRAQTIKTTKTITVIMSKST